MGIVLNEEKSEGWSTEMNADGCMVITKTFEPYEYTWGPEEYLSTATKTAIAQLEEEVLYLTITDETELTKALKDDGTESTDTYENTITNTATIEATYINQSEGEQNLILTDSISSVLTNRYNTTGLFSKRALYSRNNKDTEAIRSGNFTYTCTVRETTGTDQLVGAVLVDNGLDNRMKFTGLTIYQSSDDQNIEDLLKSLEVRYSDGTTEEIAIPVDTYRTTGLISFDTEKEVVGYTLCFSETTPFEPNSVVNVTANTTAKDPTVNLVPEGQSSTNLWNSATLTIDNLDNYSFTSDAYYHVVKAEYQLKLEKFTNSNTSTERIHAGDFFTYGIRLSGMMDPDVDYGDLKLVDILPPGIEATNATSFSTTSNGGVIKSVEIMFDYENRGVTAVVYDLDEEVLKEYLNNNTVEGSIQCVIGSGASSGTYDNHVYLLSDSVDLEQIESMSFVSNEGFVTDESDLDNDGSVEDTLLCATSPTYINNLGSEYASKMMRSDAWPGAAWTKAESYQAYTKVGDVIDYCLTVNTEANKREGLVVYDVLPAYGDANIFGGPRSSKGGSSYRMELVSLLADKPGYTNYYTTSQDVYGMTMEEAIDGVEWVTDPSDLSAVTAIKIVADEGVAMEQYTSKSFLYSARVTLSDDNKDKLSQDAREAGSTEGTLEIWAYNNFGFTFDNFSSPKQSNTVGHKISMDRTDTVTFTLTKDWIGEAQEVHIDVYMIDALEGSEGILLTDEKDRFVQTVTLNEQNNRSQELTLPAFKSLDFQGILNINAPLCYYFVERTEGNTSRLVETQYSADTRDVTVSFDSDFNPLDEPVVYKDTIDALANADTNVEVSFTNYNTSTCSISVIKKWLGDPTDEITLHLKKGTEIVDTLKLDGSQTDEDGNWIGTFNPQPIYDEETGDVIEYDVKEEAVDGYSTSIVANETEGSNDKSYEIVNTLLGNVIVHYVDEDGRTIAVDETIATGSPFGTAYDATGHKPATIEKEDGRHYAFVKVDDQSDAESGTIQKAATNVTYVYKLVTGDVTVRYEDEDGNELQDPVKIVEDGDVDTSYSATGSRPDQITKDGQRFAYKGVKSGSDSEDGSVIGDKELVITYVYTNKGSVVVAYVDENGNSIRESETEADQVSDGTAYDTKDDHWYETITKDGKTYTFVAITKNSDPEAGMVEAGKTKTVIYMYKLVEENYADIPKPDTTDQNKDGKAAKTNGAKAPQQTAAKSATPRTGDGVNVMMLGALLVLALAAAVLLKKRTNR